MNKNLKICLILVTLIVVALLAAIWAIKYWSPPPPGGPPPPPIPGDIAWFYTAQAVISTINATLAIILLITYINLYRKIQLLFTIGLIIFSMVLLLHALASCPIVLWIFGFRAYGLGPFAMLPDLFTSLALTVLLYLTFKY
jgi:hypothetical protein